MRKESTRLFVGAFLVTCVLLGGVAGFLLVELSTDRYMPGRFAPLFLIERLDSDGAELVWMGERYLLHAASAGEAQELIWQWRGMLPAPLRLAGGLAVKLMEAYDSM